MQRPKLLDKTDTDTKTRQYFLFQYFSRPILLFNNIFKTKPILSLNLVLSWYREAYFPQDHSIPKILFILRGV